MGLDAEVYAIGKFSRAIKDYLDYPAEFYKDMREGIQVFVFVFEAFTSSQSYALAEAFGASAWDFNTHKLDPDKADLQKLKDAEFDDTDITQFLKLRDAGFEFYYRPNG